MKMAHSLFGTATNAGSAATNHDPSHPPTHSPLRRTPHLTASVTNCFIDISGNTITQASPAHQKQHAKKSLAIISNQSHLPIHAAASLKLRHPVSTLFFNFCIKRIKPEKINRRESPPKPSNRLSHVLQWSTATVSARTGVRDCDSRVHVPRGFTS